MDLNTVFLQEGRRFLITDNVPDGFLKKFDEIQYEVDYYPELYNNTLSEIIHHYEGIVMSTFITLDAEMLSKAKNLKYVLRPGSGLDNIDLNYCKSNGILVFNSPEANKDSVGEHAIGILLSLLNNIPRSVEEVKKHIWKREANKGTEIKNKTIGIIGYGNTGKAIAKKLSGFDAHLLAYDKYVHDYEYYVKKSTLEEIFSQADIITIHVPLTPETYHMVDERFISKFKKTIYIINTARGKIVDTKALLSSIKKGRISGAALDVLENENLSSYTEDENKILDDLIETGKCIITPHIAGWTTEARENIFYFVLQKFQDYLSSLELMNDKDVHKVK